jgi:hypothetical protein
LYITAIKTFAIKLYRFAEQFAAGTLLVEVVNPFPRINFLVEMQENNLQRECFVALLVLLLLLLFLLLFLFCFQQSLLNAECRIVNGLNLSLVLVKRSRDTKA